MADNLDACPACGAEAMWSDSTSRRDSSDGRRVSVVSDSVLSNPDSTHIKKSGEHMVLEGKWALQDLLGKGGMGSVYRAHDMALDRTVAIKLLSATLSADPDFITRFGREAKMMAKLEHANLMPVYAVGIQSGSPFIVMKFLEGKTLEAHAQESGGVLPIDETLSFTRQLCAGLTFIHNKGVIHRDIKPANVFISPDGHVTILDLGLVRSQQQDGAGLTQTGIVVGTPGYMAPEQAVAAKDLDHRADLYAVGVILFELVTGKPPYKANSTLELLVAHREHPVPDASQINPGVHPAIAAVITRALAKSKEARFQTAAELYKVFEKATREPAVAAPSFTPSRAEVATPVASKATPAPARISRELKPVARPPSDTSVSNPFDSVQRTALEAPSPKTAYELRPAERSSKVPFIAAAAVGLALLGGGYAWLTRSPPREAPPTVVDLTPPEPVAAIEPVAPPTPAAPVEPPAPVKPPPKAPSKASSGTKRAPAASKDPVASVNVYLAATIDGGKRSWAYIDVDGKRLDFLAGATVSLVPGTYRIQLSQPGKGKAEKSITVVAGKEQSVSMELKP